jgi:putative NIF3 family GTP cyclohydrolase 1 type 2
MISVRELLEHFLSRADWVDRSNTVDRVICGDPETAADRCLVTWMPSLAALQEAAAREYSLVVCHEPVFWHHRDDTPETNPLTKAKYEFTLKHSLVVLRLHDTWDRWPEVGIPWAWAAFLGLPAKPTAVGARGYQHRYDVPPMAVGDFARRVATKCAPFGEPCVQLTGDAAQPISRIGIGTGCGCSIEAYLDMGCNCSVVCDDGSCYWSGIQMAEDLGHPVIRVNHGTSEEPGMLTLTRYIDDNVDGVTAEHLPHGSTFRLIGGDDSDAERGTA